LRSPHTFEALKEFLAEVAALPHTYLVSQRQLIEWMRSPLPLDRLATEASYLKCDTAPPGPKPCLKSEEALCLYVACCLQGRGEGC
jgi:hypothetical protein